MDKTIQEGIKLGDCYFVYHNQINKGRICTPSETLGYILEPRKDEYVNWNVRMAGYDKVVLTDPLQLKRALQQKVNAGTGIFYYEADLQDVDALKAKLHKLVDEIQ